MISGTEPGLGAQLDATRDWALELPESHPRLVDPHKGVPCLCRHEAERRAKESGRGVAVEYRELIGAVVPPLCVADIETCNDLDSGRDGQGEGAPLVASGRPGGAITASRPPNVPPALQGGTHTPGRQRDRPGTH